MYYEEARGISASVHGDDVTVKASREDADWLIQKFKERYEIKTQMTKSWVSKRTAGSSKCLARPW